MKKILFYTLLSLSLNASDLKQMLNSLKDSENIKALDLNLLAKNEAKDEVFLRYLPSLDLNLNAFNTNKDRLLIEPKNNLSASFIINALLYDGKRSANIKLADKNYQLQKIKTEKDKNEVAFNLIKLYYTYLTLEKNIEYQEKNIDYLNAELNRLNSLKNAGLKSFDELAIFTANVSLKKAQVLEYQTKKDEVLRMIHLLTNSTLIPSVDSKIQLLQDTNNSFDVAISDIQSELALLNKELKKANFYPSIYLQDNLTFANSKYDYSTFSPYDSIAKAKIKEKTAKNTILLGVKFNLFSFFADKKALESAKVQSLAAKLKNNFDKKQNKTNIENIKAQINTSKALIDANLERVKASELAFESIRQKYEAGLVSYVEYLNALELNEAANAALTLSENDLEIKKASLLNEIGVVLDERIVK